jgi:hypothetical protein
MRKTNPRKQIRQTKSDEEAVQVQQQPDSFTRDAPVSLNEQVKEIETERLDDEKHDLDKSSQSSIRTQDGEQRSKQNTP